MMIRLSTIVWLILLVFGASGLYAVKYKVRMLKAEVATTEKQLSEEKRNLHVLTAEWAYLNRPERLHALSARYLDIKPMRGQQIAEFASLPYAKSATIAKRDISSAAGVKLISGGTASANNQLGDE